MYNISVVADTECSLGALPRGAGALPRDQARARHRRKLLAATADVVAHEGLAALSVTRIVALASVSKTTFYEHFTDKNAAFAATYKQYADELYETIIRAAAPSGDWPASLRAGLSAYLTWLAARPDIARTFGLEVLAAGPEAMAARAAFHEQFANIYRSGATAARHTNPTLAPLHPTVPRALVIAINGLVEEEIREARTRQLPDMLAELHDLQLLMLLGTAMGPS